GTAGRARPPGLAFLGRLVQRPSARRRRRPGRTEQHAGPLASPGCCALAPGNATADGSAHQPEVGTDRTLFWRPPVAGWLYRPARSGWADDLYGRQATLERRPREPYRCPKLPRTVALRPL